MRTGRPETERLLGGLSAPGQLAEGTHQHTHKWERNFIMARTVKTECSLLRNQLDEGNGKRRE
jgi:tRNA G37 N-methylase TrmD